VQKQSIPNPFSRNPEAVIVTGSSRGVGAVLVDRMLDAGFYVLSIGRTKPNISHEFSSSYSHISCNFEAQGFEVEIRRWLDKNEHKFRWVGFVHCAGVVEIAPLMTTTPESIRQQISVNLSSALILSSLSLRLFGENEAKVFFLGSRARRFAFSGGAAYCASKAGLKSLADCLALEVKELRKPVGVSIFEFGTIATGFGGVQLSERQISVASAADIIFKHFVLPVDDYDIRVIEVVPAARRYQHS
jgi:NAD(P)-dependent dehydrogenase (short-subunit alcohol dehydrogenase family)